MIDARRPGLTAPDRNETENALAFLAEEMATFRVQLPELIERHEAEYVLIKGTQVVGLFHDRSQALREGYRRFGVAPFLVRQITASETVVYLANVAP